ncbi:winged helix DNA-binding domain-containing protein [soil metagenome]
MQLSDIPYQRLQNQHLSANPFKKVVDVVNCLGAVQSQDYAGAKWALALRMVDTTEQDIDDAFNRGEILRTHIMRPTWHFVAPKDLRWLLALTAPRVHAISAYYYRKSGFDETIFKRSHIAIEKVLKGGKYVTREELRNALREEHIAINDVLSSSYIIMHAELEGLICSGPRRGKQFTYALLAERVPQVKKIERNEALAELTKRYFTSHGPATIKDFSWWSGLTIADVKMGIELVKKTLQSETINGKTYWFSELQPIIKTKVPQAYLLSNYDEYTIGYRNHEAIFDEDYRNIYDIRFPHVIVIDGKVIGSWKRIFEKKQMYIQTNLFRALNTEEKESLAKATDKYATFIGMPVVLS